MTTQELHGIAHELKFWQGFVKTERFLKGWVGNCVTPELNIKVRDFIAEHLTPGSKVLDVGSGVVSILNGLVPKADLTAADPLGGLYEIIFDYKKYGINPPLPVPAEELSYKEEFDVVHISNAIDHCQNPVAAVDKLRQAVKPGGYLIMQGFENEALYENWQGFHQWNVEIFPNEDRKEGQSAGFLTITGKDMTHTIANGHYCQKLFLENNKSWFIWIQKK